MEKKNVVFLTVLAVATLLTAVVGTTFAYFTATVSYVNNVAPQVTNITTATLGVAYDDGTAVVATNSQVVPGWSTTKTVTVTNNSNVPVTYRLLWADVTNGFVKENAGTTESPNMVDNFVYRATVTSSGSDTPANISEAAMPTSDVAITAASGVSIPAGATHTYAFTFEYKYQDYNQDVNQTKNFVGKFAVTVDNVANAGA